MQLNNSIQVAVNQLFPSGYVLDLFDSLCDKSSEMTVCPASSWKSVLPCIVIRKNSFCWRI